MKVDINSYAESLINGVSQNMYEGLLSVMCLGIVLLLAWKRRKSGRYIAGLFLIEYSFLLYCSTVIYRKGLRERGCDLMPFWSYKAIMDGKEQYLAENIMNVVVFVPVGLLFGFASSNRNFRIALMLGVGMSVGIELLQFVFKKGFTEVDDIMHNTLGCLIGFGVYVIIRFVYEKFSNSYLLG